MWSTEALPVPADLVVYTAAEWQRLQAEDGRFARTLRREAKWLVKTDGPEVHGRRRRLAGPSPGLSANRTR